MITEIFKPINIKSNIKVIRDSVHGYISIPDVILSEIVDTEIFQRLRRIEQTSMRSLFPSARHDRFAHSLGVYFLGDKAFKGLFENAKIDKYINENKEELFFWQRHYWVFLLSCLLHDCGHAPFSHSFEYVYLLEGQLAEVRTRMIETMTDLHLDSPKINQIEVDYNEYFDGKPNPHESISALVIVLYYKDKIASVLKELIGSEYKEDFLIDDIEFMQRAIIGLHYSTDNIKDKMELGNKNLKNCFISLLNSNSFDVDKLDYIVRDSSFSGMDNMSVDIERLLKSITIIEKHEINTEYDIDSAVDNIFQLNHGEFSLSEYIENGDTCPNEINLKVTGSVKFKGTLKGEIDAKKGTVIKEGIEKPETVMGKIDQPYNYDKIEAVIEDGYIRGSFVGQVERLQGPTYEIDGGIKSKIIGKIKGLIIGKINFSSVHPIQYSLGYRKSALNIIEDTLLARNRLYLWSYAHHTVTYADYALRQAVLLSFAKEQPGFEKKKYSEIIEAGNAELKKCINIDSLLDKTAKFYLIDDGDLTSYIKRNLSKGSESINKYSFEWLQRTPQKPLWKSYADYNAYFSPLTKNERRVLWEMLFYDNAEVISENIDKESKIEGNIRQFPESVLNKCRIEYGLEDVDFVWIRPGGVKWKTLDANSTFLSLGESVRRLSDALVRSKIGEEYADNLFFYLYLDKKLDTKPRQKVLNFLKENARQLAPKIVRQ
jgi:HD superfamily phosphohydrolase